MELVEEGQWIFQLEATPLAIVGVNPGTVNAEKPAILILKVLEIIPGYTSENI
ncbi:MAG: hypothetical protein AB1767_01865 [Bacillota bacterium]